MKTILWLCNTPLPEIQDKVGVRNYNEGWLVGISSQLRKRKDIIFHYAFCQNRFKRTMKWEINGITFWGIYVCHKTPYEIRKENVKIFGHIIDQIAPDIIHIFGTEYAHALECIYGVSDKSRVLVSVQGLTSELAKIYLKGIPFRYRLSGVIDDGRFRSLIIDQVEFYKRGKNEKKILQNVGNIIGRTEWDRRCIKKNNSKCKYYHCNEILRNTFYEGQWSIENIQKYSLFVSQANYPIKGLHILISALPLIKKRFPDTKVYIGGGRKLIEGNTPYSIFIKKQMKRMDLEDSIVFLGFLTAERVKRQLQKTHVMIMPSLLENSPNSIGEAMLLGTPVVASNVGGIPDILQDGIEGYLYSGVNERELSTKVCRIFGNDRLANFLSENGRRRAKQLYSQSKNVEQLLEIYRGLTPLEYSCGK